MASASSGSTDYRASPVPSTASSTVSMNSVSTPAAVAASDKPADESSKLRTFLSILRKYVLVQTLRRSRLREKCHRFLASHYQKPGATNRGLWITVLSRADICAITDSLELPISLPSGFRFLHSCWNPHPILVRVAELLIIELG